MCMCTQYRCMHLSILIAVPPWAIVVIAIVAVLLLLCCCICVIKKCCRRKKKKDGKKGLKGAVDLKSVQLLGSTMKEKVGYFLVQSLSDCNDKCMYV